MHRDWARRGVAEQRLYRFGLWALVPGQAPLGIATLFKLMARNGVAILMMCRWMSRTCSSISQRG